MKACECAKVANHVGLIEIAELKGRGDPIDFLVWAESIDSFDEFVDAVAEDDPLGANPDVFTKQPLQRTFAHAHVSSKTSNAADGWRFFAGPDREDCFLARWLELGDAGSEEIIGRGDLLCSGLAIAKQGVDLRTEDGLSGDGTATQRREWAIEEGTKSSGTELDAEGGLSAGKCFLKEPWMDAVDLDAFSAEDQLNIGMWKCLYGLCDA